MSSFLEVLEFMENRNSYNPKEQLLIIKQLRETRPSPSVRQDQPEPS